MGNKQPPIIFPYLRCRPDLIVGMPVFLANARFALVIPRALFGENESPGMPVFVPLRLLGIYITPTLFLDFLQLEIFHRLHDHLSLYILWNKSRTIHHDLRFWHHPNCQTIRRF